MSLTSHHNTMTFPTVLESFYAWEQNFPQRPYLHQPIDGQLHTLSWGEVALQARQVAAALQAQGYPGGSRIGILSKNCAQWFISDLAIMLAGYISVPIFATAGQSTIRYVCEHADVQLMFVGKLDDTQVQLDAIPQHIKTVAFPYPAIPATTNWDEFIDVAPFAGKPIPDENSVATIIYTSGSTGQPKGVVHTFASICWSAKNIVRAFDAKQGDRMLSYLPLAHITERVWVELASLYSGCEIWYVESLDTFQRDVQACSPTLFISVPRLWTKFQMGILAKVPQRKLNILLRIPVIKNLIAKKIRKGLGLNDVRLNGSGSAPLSPAVIEWFAKLGINISEGWGMTENCAYGTACIPFRHDKIGSIGSIQQGVNIRISEEGEIQVKGQCNMLEYYLEPEKTAEVFTPDGYHKTGDKGRIDNDGYVYITGRLKDIFKTSKGKYVTPAPIEAKFMANPVIEQVCVTGSGLPQPIALVVLSEDGGNLPRKEINEQITTFVRDINVQLESHQKLDRVIICNEAWTPENEILTPTLKVRRHVLEEKLRNLIQREYREKVVWA